MAKTREEKIQYLREWRIKNKDAIAQRAKQRYEENKDELLRKKSEYYQENKELILKRSKEFRLKNKDFINKKARIRNHENKEKRRKQNKESRDRHKDRINESQRIKSRMPEAKAKRKEYEKNNAEKIKQQRKKHLPQKIEQERVRMKTDIKFRTNKLMSKAFRNMLLKSNMKKNGTKWLSYVDYSLDELIEHLKKSLRKLNRKSAVKYKWSDFLSGKLHIDHILPKSKFDFDSPDHPEFKRCWSLKNLRLLPEIENLSKGAKCESFQTAF